MAINSEMLIKVNADIKDFDKKFEQIQKRTKDLGEALNKTATVAGVAFAGLVAITVKTVSEFKNANQASILLENSLRNQGIFSEKLVDSYKDMAKELSKLTNVDDDAIIKGQAILQRFVGQNKITKELTLQTINLAKAQGIDLDSAFNLVGKTIGGKANPLARQLAINLEDGLTVSEKMTVVTEKLASRLDGVAEGMAKAEGPTGALSIAFENLQESIGEKLKPAFDGVAGILLKFTNAVEESELAVGSIAGLISTGLVFTGLVTGAALAVKGFLALQAAALALGVELTILTGGIFAIALAAGAIVAVTVAANKGTKSAKELSEQLVQATKDLEQLKKKNITDFGVARAVSMKVDEIKMLQQKLKVIKETAKVEEDIQKKKDNFKSESDKIEEDRKKKEDARKQAESDAKKLIADRKALAEQIVDAGRNELEKLEALRERRIKLAGNDKVLLLQIEKDYQAEKLKLEEKSNKEFFELAKERLAKIKAENEKALTDGVNNPFKSSLGPDATDEQRKQESLGRGAGLLNNVANGAAGAKNLVTEGAAAGLDTFAPGLGQALKPLISQLTQGPEATRAFVKEFADAIPDLIQGLIEAIPVLIEELANQFPVVIDRLMERLPEITSALAKSMPKVAVALALESPKIAAAFIKQIPSMAVEFINTIVKEAPRFITELIKSLSGAFSGGILGGGGGGLGGGLLGSLGGGLLGGPIGSIIGGGVVGDVFDSFGFATGGQFAKNVPSGFANDTFPARLSSGELVVDRSTASGLREFIDRENGGGSDVNTALLNQILSALKAPITTTATAVVGDKAFADIFLRLSRNNQIRTV